MPGIRKPRIIEISFLYSMISSQLVKNTNWSEK